MVYFHPLNPFAHAPFCRYGPDAEDKAVGADDVLVKMLAAPINPADMNMVRESCCDDPFAPLLTPT